MILVSGSKFDLIINMGSKIKNDQYIVFKKKKKKIEKKIDGCIET